MLEERRSRPPAPASGTGPIQVSTSKPILNRYTMPVKGFYNRYVGIEIPIYLQRPSKDVDNGRKGRRAGPPSAVDTSMNRALIICLIRWEGAPYGIQGSCWPPTIDPLLRARQACRAREDPGDTRDCA